MHEGRGSTDSCRRSRWLGPALPEAATYYVRNGGSDSADGRSHATAWASLGKVNGYSVCDRRHRAAARGRSLRRVRSRSTGLAPRPRAPCSAPTTSTAHASARLPQRAADHRWRGPLALGPLRRARAPCRANSRASRESARRGLRRARHRRLNVNDAEIIGYAFTISTTRRAFLNDRSGIAGREQFRDGRRHRQPAGRRPLGRVDRDRSQSNVRRSSATTSVSEVYGEGINTHSGSQYTLIEHNSLFGVRAVGIYSDARARHDDSPQYRHRHCEQRLVARQQQRRRGHRAEQRAVSLPRRRRLA